MSTSPLPDNATATTSPAPETFSQIVRATTAERHSAAEHSSFMTDLMKGDLNAAAYTRLLAQYEFIYEALETVAAEFRRAGHPLTQAFDHPGLDRLDSIRADLRQLAGEDHETELLPSTARYADRIRATVDTPERFLAHHYLRYLGDLSGGQAVAALMARHYEVPSEGLSMYRFPELPKPKVFKDQYRVLLDEAPFTQEQRDAFLEEAIAGFDLNAEVFADLEKVTSPSAAS